MYLLKVQYYTLKHNKGFKIDMVEIRPDKWSGKCPLLFQTLNHCTCTPACMYIDNHSLLCYVRRPATTCLLINFIFQALFLSSLSLSLRNVDAYLDVWCST